MLAKLNLTLFLCVLALTSVAGFADDSLGSSPDVRAVLFYDPNTSQGKELFTFYLPALHERYGARLEVAGIDLPLLAGKRAYSAVAERLGLPPQPGEEPAIVVGDRAIVGLFDIATALGDNFENLAKDPSTRNWPSDPALQELLPGGIETVKARVAREGVLPTAGTGESSDEFPLREQIANSLAIVVLVGMVAALIHSLVRLRQHDKIPGRVTSGVLFLTLVVGFAISAYTAYTALAEVEPMCGPIGGCATVQESEYSKLFGIPMGVLGLIGYSLILVTWLMARHLSPQGGGWYWLPWAVALLGVLFSLRLTALEPFVIGATCLWCLGSVVSITLALWVLSVYTRQVERDT